MSCARSLLFTNAVARSLTYYDICVKTFSHTHQRNAPSHAEVPSRDLLESDHFPLG